MKGVAFLAQFCKYDFMGIKVYSEHSDLRYKYSRAGRYSMQLANNVSAAVFSGESTNNLKSQLVSVQNLNEKFMRMGVTAFAGCTGLSSVTFNDTIEEICASCFSECPNLASAPISPSVREIGDCAFSRCRNMVRFEFKHFEDDDACGDVAFVLKRVGGRVLDGADKCGDAVLPSSIDSLSEIDEDFLKDSAVSSVTMLGVSAQAAKNISESRCLGLGSDCVIYTSDGKRLAYVS